MASSPRTYRNVKLDDKSYERLKSVASDMEVTLIVAVRRLADYYEQGIAENNIKVSQLEEEVRGLRQENSTIKDQYLKVKLENAMLTGRMMNVPSAKERDDIDLNYRLGQMQDQQTEQNSPIYNIPKRKPEVVKSKFVDYMSGIALSHVDELVRPYLSEEDMALYGKDGLAFYRAIEKHMGEVFDRYSAMDSNFSMEDYLGPVEEWRSLCSPLLIPPIPEKAVARFVARWLQQEAGKPLDLSDAFHINSVTDTTEVMSSDLI